MIVTVFRTCIVCGADVLCLPDTGVVAMCSTHSKTDKLNALTWIEKEINKVRKEINGGN